MLAVWSCWSEVISTSCPLPLPGERDTHLFCGYFNLFHQGDAVAFVIVVVREQHGSIGLRQLGDGALGGCRGCW